MKVVILAGGFGTRLSEETHLKPKPMVNIGDWPIMWHIMKLYSHYGFSEFILCLGYKAYVVKEYFANYQLYHSDVTFDFKTGGVKIHKAAAEDWSVTCIDTGLETMTLAKYAKSWQNTQRAGKMRNSAEMAWPNKLLD